MKALNSFVTGLGFEILPIRVFSMVEVRVSPEVNALAAADVIDQGEFQNNVGDAMKLYDGYWEKLKTEK